jgi:uncharacterized protein (TIGR02246 family)
MSTQGGQMREFHFSDERTIRVAGRFWSGCTARRQLRRAMVASLALAAMLCGSNFVYGQNQKDKNNKKKDADAGFSTAPMLPDAQAIDLLVTQMLGAWQAGDAEGMHKFYADDITVISGAWEQPLFGWASYARAYQGQFARTSGARLERTNSYTKVIGDMGLVTYQWQFIGDVDGKRAQAFGHTTLVLQKRAGNWVIILNHTSVVPTDESSSVTPKPPGEPTSSLAPNQR